MEPAAQWSADDVASHLGELGFTRVTLDETGRAHYEFDAIDADGREIEVEFGFDGVLRKFDVDDDRRAETVDLLSILPQDVQDAAASRGFSEVTEYEAGPRHYKLEGYSSDGRELEIEFSADNVAGTVSVDDGRGPVPTEIDLQAVTTAVEGAGYTVSEIEQKPRHIEMLATNPEGENVRLHTDFEGAVYREILVR